MPVHVTVVARQEEVQVRIIGNGSLTLAGIVRVPNIQFLQQGT